MRQSKRILSAFAFTLLTIFLLLVVASRSSEAATADDNVNIDAGLSITQPEATDRGTLPGSKPEQTDRTETKPDIDISSWEYILAGPDNNIGSYTPYVVAIENTAQYFDERAVGALTDFLNAARSAGYSPLYNDGLPQLFLAELHI